MKKITAVFILLMSTIIINAQTTDTGIFERLTAEMKEFKLDTSTAPNDKLTKKIIELRTLRGGFNITEAIAFKIAEERTKEGANKAEIDKMDAFFTTGNGKRWLDNAVTWIYRKQFTYEEVSALVKFYKTTAGKKMANSFPLIMVQSLKAAEDIQEQLKQQQTKP